MAENRIVPLKWEKAWALVTFGIRQLSDLESGVRRFERAHWSELFNEIATALHQTPDGPVFYIVKLIHPTRLTGLPNLRVRFIADLSNLRSYLDHAPLEFIEAWFCKTDVSGKCWSTAGRVAFSRQWSGQIVEQVWNESPRAIDRLGPEAMFPYVRATRPNWGWSYRIETVHTRGQTDDRLRSEFVNTMRRWEEKRDLIEGFGYFLEQVGITEYSFEYKDDGIFHVIDWDTSDDVRAIRALRECRHITRTQIP